MLHHFKTIDALIFSMNKILNNVFYLSLKYRPMILGQPVYIYTSHVNTYMDIDNNYSIKYNRKGRKRVDTNVDTMIHYYYVNEIIGLSCIQKFTYIF